MKAPEKIIPALPSAVPSLCNEYCVQVAALAVAVSEIFHKALKASVKEK